MTANVYSEIEILTMKTAKPPCIGVFGNLLGRNAGYVTTQGQILSELLTQDGYDVVSASSKISRSLRILDVARTLLGSRRRIEIVILEVYSGLGFVLADTVSFLAKLCRIPVIMVLHGGNLPKFEDHNPQWVKRVFDRAVALVSPSTFMSEEMGQRGFDVRVIPNVIDLNNYPYKPRTAVSPKLLWMRSFHKVYNPQMALEAFAAIKLEVPNAELVMAGVDKGLEGPIKRSAEEMGLQNAVRFPGFLEHESKVREFSAADIYLNTNRIDNMPVSVVEACSMGLPVVATDVGGLSRLITHRQNGLLVPDGDSNQMARAVIELMNNNDLAERLSRNGRILAERSAWHTVRESWEELFEQILNGKGASDRPNIPARVCDTVKHSI